MSVESFPSLSPHQRALSPHQRALSPHQRVPRLPVVPQPDQTIRAAAQARLDSLTKPIGSLGYLEDVATQLCVIAQRVPAPVPQRPAIAVFAGDHGVVAAGVTPWPQEVTAQMVANFVAGGAAINALSKQSGAELVVVDVGVASNIETELAPTTSTRLVQRRVAGGTADLSTGAAMTDDQAAAAFHVGVDIATELVSAGVDLLACGEMGIGNTTAAAAIIAALTGRDARDVVGRGTGIDDAMLSHKQLVVSKAVKRAEDRCRQDAPPGLTSEERAWVVLQELGGLEIAALAGYMVSGASHGCPVVVDGVITLSAALIALDLAPNTAHYLVAGHRSTEPGATIALDRLGLRPLIDLDLRLGEGTGAALAIPIVRAAAALLAEMATFGDAGIAPE
jgi:nicotinate-nucleotide--dimethylbenzimidazole phosphoribosyltransferase